MLEVIHININLGCRKKKTKQKTTFRWIILEKTKTVETVNWGLRKGIWSQVMSFQHMHMNFCRMNNKMYSIKIA